MKDELTPNDSIGPSNHTLALFLISVLGLFLEMLLIRWISTEISILAYLQNVVLVVCFLGLGLGCFTSRQPIVFRKTLFHLFLLLLVLAIPLTREAFGKISLYLSVLGYMTIWHFGVTGSLRDAILAIIEGLFGTFAIMIVLLNVFVPIGRVLGRLMDNHPNTIWAYSVNVAGSLAGTWLFVLLSILSLPLFAWFLVLGVFALFFLDRKCSDYKLNLVLIISIMVLSAFAGWVPGSLNVIWSPYQKLVLKNSDYQKGQVGKFVVTVNNTGYQAMIDLKESFIRTHPEQFPPEMSGLSQYDIPLLLHPHPQGFLIVGAGTGNDVAGALRHQVKKIVAVEIDPAIISLGQRYHPEHPYSVPTVQVVNDDARSFFATCKQKFDVISFGLLDSHTTTAMTNARLDHYVYTRESIEHAKSLLAKGGILVLSFEAQKPFIADRMARVLKEVFDEKPIVFRMPFSNYGWGGVIFIAGDLVRARQQISQNPRLASLIGRLQKQYPQNLTYTTKIVTDDWPYIYLKSPSIPLLYFLLAGLMVLLFIMSSKQWHATDIFAKWNRSDWHFFFLGAAFLLLEVQNISKASVVLGNTWEVNAVVVSAVLVMILLANLLAARFPKIPLTAVYTLLCATCLGLYFVDLARFAFLPYATKAFIVGALTTLPMLFSGIVFIQSFAAVARKDEALGANLLGALVGALLQSATFVTGIKALLLIVGALYILSWITKPQIVAPAVVQKFSSST
jgi:spermidine synthase